MRVYTPSSTTLPPQEDSKALPHLHSSQQLVTGLTASFPQLCMKKNSSKTKEEPRSQSGFIISCLLFATNVQGASAAFWVCMVAGPQHVQITPDNYM